MNKRLWAFCTIFLQLFCISFSQPVLNPPTYWKHLPLSALPQPPRSQLLPSAYAAFELDGRLLQQLDALSARAGSQGERELLLYVPTPEGSYEPFYIRPANIMAPGLAARYTRIRAYQGVHAKQPATEIRLERGPSGLHAMIFGQGQSVFIAPIYPNDSRLYMAYYKQQAPRRGPFSCSLKTEHLRGDLPQPTARSGDCLLRTYRLAVATTGEYTAYHGGTVEQALAAIVTTINRVNGIFEREVGVRMVLIDSTDQLIFTDPVSDPFTNDNGSEMLTQNQQLCDARIGSANYDIGHVFSTNGGGIAYLRSVCEAGYKAGGVTGQPYPQGDAFDIDFVAHEMGHQFGATHTQNNDCNRSNNSAFEPGSASTIMGYAGICPPNIQTHSDAMFHAFSIAQIRQFIEGEANGCANIQPLNNQPPTANAGVDAYIPAATPFFLRGSATDPDAGQQLTYSWEQMDNEIASMPPEADATGGPLFRTFLPSTEPVRYFPAYEDLRTNKRSPWEVLPTVSRELNFRLTVRDNAPGGGCTAADDVVLQVVGQAGPFAISWPQAGTNWTGGTYQEVRWQVAGTDQPPISCGAVDVLLSVDGGRTFPYVLADSAPNTGAVVVQLPEVSSQQARILLQGHGHRFFHLLPQNFSITEAAAPGFSMLVQQGESLACPADTFVYQVQLSSLKGFEQPVTLSVSGLPEGTVAQWGTNPLMPSGSTELRLVLPAHALPGQYQLSLLAQAAGAQSQQAQLSLRMLSAQPLAGDELMPRHGSREVDPGRELSWLPASGPATYELQWSLNPAFLPGEIQHITQLDENRYLPAEPFPANEVIYWRVRAVNACGSGPFGPARAFHTAAINCWRVVSTDSVPIPQSGTPTVVSTIAVQQAETLSRLR
ncbi:MAG: propanediol utilization protein, partial [Bacteroidetes bacterium]